jgi:hypothetical protein
VNEKIRPSGNRIIESSATKKPRRCHFFVDIALTVPQYLGCRTVATQYLATRCTEVDQEANLEGGTYDAGKEESCKEEKEITCSGAKSPPNEFFKGK